MHSGSTTLSTSYSTILLCQYLSFSLSPFRGALAQARGTRRRGKGPCHSSFLPIVCKTGGVHASLLACSLQPAVSRRVKRCSSRGLSREHLSLAASQADR